MMSSIDFLQTYKVYKCPTNCDNKFCMFWHENRTDFSKCDRRRDPSQYSYELEPCLNVFRKNAENPKSRKDIKLGVCKDGDKCNYSHSFYEMWWHPIVWKVKQCSFERIGCEECPWVQNNKEIDALSDKIPLFKDDIDNINILFAFEPEIMVRCIDACPHNHEQCCLDRRYNCVDLNKEKPLVPMDVDANRSKRLFRTNKFKSFKAFVEQNGIVNEK